MCFTQTKAEKLHDLTYITKSNSLRRAAKDKDDNWNPIVISWRQLAFDWRTVKLKHQCSMSDIYF